MCHNGTVVGVVDLQSLANYAQLLLYYAMPALLVKPSYYAYYYAS